MLTIYNFSLHKSPQQGYDRQKKKCKTTISPLLTFNLKVGFTFSVLSILRVRDKWLISNVILRLWADVKYHVPTGFGFSPKASGFYPFGDATDLVRGRRW